MHDINLCATMECQGKSTGLEDCHQGKMIRKALVEKKTKDSIRFWLNEEWFTRSTTLVALQWVLKLDFLYMYCTYIFLRFTISVRSTNTYKISQVLNNNSPNILVYINCVLWTLNLTLYLSASFRKSVKVYIQWTKDWRTSITIYAEVS